MTTFNPLDRKDQKTLVKAIQDLPAATEQEIVETFSQTKESWEQGKSPKYIHNKNLEDQIKDTLTVACRTIERKKQIVTRFDDGRIGYIEDKQKPYMGSSWNHEVMAEEKKLQINLVLEVVPDSLAWIPFVYMKREDGEYAFWFNNTL